MGCAEVCRASCGQQARLSFQLVEGETWKYRDSILVTGRLVPRDRENLKSNLTIK